MKKIITIATIIFIFLIFTVCDNDDDKDYYAEMIGFAVYKDNLLCRGFRSNFNFHISMQQDLYDSGLNLIAELTMSEGAKAYIGDVLQVSGVTRNDFTDDVIYTVVSKDGSVTADYNVSISRIIWGEGDCE